MAITKTILKKVRQQAVVAFTGTGTSTIDLDADLKLSDETFLGYANANVNISSVVYSTGNVVSPALVIRNSSNVLMLFQSDNLSFSQSYGYVLNQNNTSNISITLPSPEGGTIILGLTKAAGYASPDRQVLQPKDL